MPSNKKPHNSQNRARKVLDHRTQKQKLDASSYSSVPTSLVQSSLRPSPKRYSVSNVEDIKNRAFRTEELTQRAHRFNFQLAIDLREILQAEFDSLEKFSADPKSSVLDLKTALMGLSIKIMSEVDKQMDVQKKIAEAYETMYQEVNDKAKEVLTELDTARLSVEETDAATRLLSDVMNVIRESVEYWVTRPQVLHKKLNDLKRDGPREGMSLNEMYDRLESQIRLCHKALEHPMAGAISISKELAKLNITRKNASS